MKIKLLFFLMSAFALPQLSFTMESPKDLTPIHTIHVNSNFTIKSITPNKKKSTINLLLLKENKPYLGTYNLESKSYTQQNEPIDQNNHKYYLSTLPNPNSLPEDLGPYTVQYLNNTATLYETTTQKHFCNLLHNTPITCAALHQDGTKIITASGDGIVKIWQLKQPIIFTCGESKISVENSKKNIKILKESMTLKYLLEDIDSATQNAPIPLLYINTLGDFHNFFRLMKLSYKNYIYTIEKELSNLSIGQLYQLAIQSTYYDITNKSITATICKAIAQRYNPTNDRADIKLLPHDIEKIIVRYRIVPVLNYIDHHIKPLSTFKAFGSDWCTAVAYSHDNTKILKRDDNTIHIYNRRTLMHNQTSEDHLYTLIGHNKIVNTILISSDDKSVLSMGSDHTINIWNIYDHECAKQKLLSELTIEQADLLTEQMYLVLKENSIFTIKEGSTEHIIWKTITPEAQKYLHNFVSIEKEMK